MGYGILGSIWRRLPAVVRLRLIRISQPTFTVSAAAVVLNSKSEVLLLNHVLRPSTGWGLPGGFLDESEHPADAIRRELKEETGIGLSDVRMLRVRTYKRHIEILFSAATTDEAQVLSREISELGWFRFEDIPERLPQGQKDIIERVLKGEV